MEKVDVMPLDRAKLTSKIIVNQRILRLTDIFNRLSVFCLIMMLVCLFSTIATPVAWLFVLSLLLIIVLALIIFTFGTIFFMPNSPIEFLWGLITKLVENVESMNVVMEFCFNAIDWFNAFGIAFSVLGIIFASISKGKGKVGKIITLSIFTVICVAILAFNLITGGFHV